MYPVGFKIGIGQGKNEDNKQYPQDMIEDVRKICHRKIQY